MRHRVGYELALMGLSVGAFVWLGCSSDDMTFDQPTAGTTATTGGSSNGKGGSSSSGGSTSSSTGGSSAQTGGSGGSSAGTSSTAGSGGDGAGEAGQSALAGAGGDTGGGTGSGEGGTAGAPAPCEVECKIIGGECSGTVCGCPSNTQLCFDANACVPVNTGCIGSGTGLRGQYYAGASFIEYKGSRLDGSVDFSWAEGIAFETVPTNFFSVRWEGWVEPRWSGDYTFYTESDDGQRLWVDGKLVIDDWKLHGPTEKASEPLTLEAGKKYAIRMDYFEHTGGATARLRWSSDRQTKGIIPSTQLYPADISFVPKFTTYEAESADNTLVNATASDCEQCSGGALLSRVGLKVSNDSKIIFNKVTAPAAGVYKLRIWSTNKGTNATGTVSVNGGLAQDVIYVENYNDASVFQDVELAVDLLEGNNVITLAGVANASVVVNIDRITVE